MKHLQGFYGKINESLSISDIDTIFPNKNIAYYHSEDNKFEYNGKFYEFDSRMDNEVGSNIDRKDVVKFIKKVDVVVYLENNEPVCFSPRKLMLEMIRNVGSGWLPRFKHMYIDFDMNDPYCRANIFKINNK